MGRKKKTAETVEVVAPVADAVVAQTRGEFYAAEKEKMAAKMEDIKMMFDSAARFKAGARRLRLLTVELTKMLKDFRDASMRVDGEAVMRGKTAE